MSRGTVGGAQEAGAEEQDLLLERTAAIDVAKASGMVCTRVPSPTNSARRAQEVWEVASTTSAILRLADELMALHIERVVLESTGDYWRPFLYLLEASGLTVWLVNARDVKHVPGRPKTDKLDAIWLCKLNERGMLRPSFVPPTEIRTLRQFTRLRTELVREQGRHKQRTEKLLEDALIKVSSVATDLFGVSGRAMMEALIAGERDPQVLADLARGRMRVKRGALVEALTGRFEDHHAQLLRILLDQVDFLGEKIQVLTQRIEALIAAMPAAQAPSPGPDSDLGPQGPQRATPLNAVTRLDEATGIGPRTAQIIIAELGLNMDVFPTERHLVSWAKLSPKTIQSGKSNKSGGVGKGNSYLKAALSEAATAAAKTDTFLGARYRRLVKRTGKGKALVAVARSILVIVWHLLKDPTTRFCDLGADYYSRQINRDRKVRNLIHQLQALGYEIPANPAA